ncbi:MAG TPA: amino acid adenylation domain-containing protein, partial [Longimicrobium sp.]|nr:amino acid adenylation domain-containing protein [Longimicrobium sp.]
DIPFEQVVELVQPARSMAHAPLFQAMFTWQNAPGGGAGLPGLTPAPLGPAEPPDRPAAGPIASASFAQATANATANVDLSLVLSERGGMIAGGVTYATALFDRETVERYAGYLRRVLEEMAADETRRVDRLEIVAEDERRRMVEEWNRTDAPAPGESCVHALFEAQAERAPDAEAVVFDRERLTYAALNAAANRLARRLRAAGVGPEARVGVMLERSAELVVALLAVLKAGGAYLPLDPALPAARRAALAADAGAAVLVTREPALEGFAGTIVSPAQADGEDGDDLGLDVPAAALAYVIYTSGSTGTPKGVGVAHAEAAAHCRAAAAAYGLTPADRVLQFAAVGFDVSVEQVLAPLSAGACVVVRGNEVPTPLELARRAAAQGLTVINLPTAYWHQLAADRDALELLAGSVRLVIAGGEAMSPAATREWAAGPAAGVRLLNGYGPTETVVTCTGYDVPAALPDGAVHVPVGRPFGGRTAYVLDGRGEPAPLGVPGELCIGGVLARGYLGRPAATAQAFVPDPFSATPGARMYRTGDRARWLAAGELEFLGRRDFQVKIRGFRIEPGEIEARLAEHEGVREAVVVAREDVSGDRRLVAYVVASSPVEADALRAHLGARLPEHMVPAAYVALDAFPLTPTGKVDRRALPAPEGDAFARRGYEAPVGETEEALAEIFAEVLVVERVGRHDNFFELGGHSLLAVRVISRVRQVLGVEAPLAHLFSHPTVESLSARLSEPERQLQVDRAIAIRSSGSQPPLFLAYEGTGSTLYAQVLHPHIDAEIPVYALPAPSPSEPPLRTVEGMATRLVRMIREVQPSGPYRLAGWSFGGVLSYEVAAQLIGRDEVVEFVGMFDSYHPVRVGAVSHDAAQEHALLLHVLRMAEAVEPSGRADPDEAGVATGGVDLETFVTRCREKGLLPGHVTVEQAGQMRDRLRDHQRALGEYAPLPLPVAVHLFPARQSADPDPSRGWQATLPAAQLRVTPVPGTHLSMMRAPNAATLGEALSRALGRARDAAAPLSAGDRSPLVTLQGGAGGAAPLFCVPGAGSGVTTFMDLMWALGPSVPLQGLQPRGLDGETPPHATVQAAAEHNLRALREACPAGPVHLLGHSFGGWVALEMALRLHEAGRPAASLTILDSEVPDDSEAVIREYGGREAFLKLVEVLELTVERSLGIGPAEVASRDEAGWLKLLHGKMVGLGLLGARTTPEVLADPFRTFARCLRTTYRPSGVYPGRLRLVLVDDPAKDEAANRAHFAEVERGWREWAPGLVFSAGAGNHVTALKLPHVAVLAGLLAEEARRGGGGSSWLTEALESGVTVPG